jgi:hypothetical protein
VRISPEVLKNRIAKCSNRWYKLIEHPVQLALDQAVPSGMRFPIVPAGRRSGKTERFKRFLAKTAMQQDNKKFFAGAPTYNQAKKIFWDDLKTLTFSPMHKKQPSESDLIIFMPNNTEIHVVGFDNSARFEGIQWDGGGIDEVGNLKEDALNTNIMPALDTVNPTDPGYRAWCWLFGVPEGLNFYYDIAMYARDSGDPLYGLFHWKSSEILPQDVIEAAKRTMSAKQFKQEYEASFETASGRIYEDYDKENVTNETIQETEQLHWMHDFNYTPMSSAIGVIRQDKLFILDEIILESAVSRQSAEEFVERYKEHKNKNVIIYGDPAGRAGEKHHQESDYTEIETVLRNHKWQFQRCVKKAAPAIKDRQNALRARIKNAVGEISLFINPYQAKYCHKGLSTVQVKKGSSFLEEQSDYQHVTTAIGYMVEYKWPINRGFYVSNIGYGY